MFSDCFCCCVDWKCKMAAGHRLTYDTMEIKKKSLVMWCKKIISEKVKRDNLLQLKHLHY